jgi:hypothetical protein
MTRAKNSARYGEDYMERPDTKEDKEMAKHDPGQDNGVEKMPKKPKQSYCPGQQYVPRKTHVEGTGF